MTGQSDTIVALKRRLQEIERAIIILENRDTLGYEGINRLEDLRRERREMIGLIGREDGA